MSNCKRKELLLVFSNVKNPRDCHSFGKEKSKDYGICWNLEISHLWLPSACIIFSFHPVYKTKRYMLVTHASVYLLVVRQQKPARARPVFSIIAIIIVSWRPSQVIFSSNSSWEMTPIHQAHDLSPFSSWTQARRSTRAGTLGWAAPHGPPFGHRQVPTSHALKKHKELTSTNGKNAL